MSEVKTEETTFERRRALRVPVAITVEVRDGRGFSLHSSKDLSAGGVFFDRAIPHPVGAKVSLTFTLPGDVDPIRCDGEVVNVPNAKTYGMGVRFQDLSQDDLTRLLAFVQAHMT